MREAVGSSTAAPLLLVGGSVAALAALGQRWVARGDTADGGGVSSIAADRSLSREAAVAELWVWPLPRWNGYMPSISNGFQRGQNVNGKPVDHRGVDVMYPRSSATDQADRYPARSTHGSRNHFMPDAIPVLAVRDGHVWSAGMTRRGYSVVIDHGPPWATYYTHLAEMFVWPTQSGRSGQRVRAGDVIGHVGADPLDGQGLMHLHFELWHGGGREAAIDPEPLMTRWIIAPGRAIPTDAVARNWAGSAPLTPAWRSTRERFTPATFNPNARYQ